MRKAPHELQLEYYASTARAYDDSHIHDVDEHQEALEFITTLLPGLGARTVLDTGCGTGRGMRFLRERCPGLTVRGNDPSRELLRVAHERHGLPLKDLVPSDTLALPDRPGAYDVVVSLAVLHHVPRSRPVVEKMLELASKAVFISDSNCFGQGSLPKRLVKLALAGMGLWRPMKFVAQGFKPYMVSEGDGISYSYSVFSDLSVLQEHCRRVWAMPLGTGSRIGAAAPLLGAGSVLVCGLK